MHRTDTVLPVAATMSSPEPQTPRLLLWLLPSLLLAVACSSGGATATPPSRDGGGMSDGGAETGSVDASDGGTAIALWTLSRSGPNEFAMPWPNELARDEAGYVDLGYVPGRAKSELIASYIDSMKGVLRGFSTVGATYFRFSEALDETSLPSTVETTLSPEAAVQLIDLEGPASLSAGRHPAKFYVRKTATDYWSPHTLAVAPATGHPLRPGRLYAAVVTRKLRSAGGGGFSPANDLQTILGDTAASEPALESARQTYSPWVSKLAEFGVERSQILSLALFRTSDPVAETCAAVDLVNTWDDATNAVSSTPTFKKDSKTGFEAYTSQYGPQPIFQRGVSPYVHAPDGDFVLDDRGVPQVQMFERSFTYTVTVPKTTMPAGGYPVAIYAHGTGGNSKSFVGDGTAASLASKGILGVSFDQVFAGDRTVGSKDPVDAMNQFTNFTNLRAGRSNTRQAAIDHVTMKRFIVSGALTRALQTFGDTAKVDASKLFFFGHSQGGFTGPLWLACDTKQAPTAAVLSGAGGSVALSLTQKTSPANVPGLLTILLGMQLSKEEPEMVELHPALTLMQTIMDVSDPVNYGRLVLSEPRAGGRPVSVLQTQGFVDTYIPPDTIAALGLSMGLTIQEPYKHPIPNYALLGLPVAATSLRGNLTVGASRATAAFQQYDATNGRDGHFVVFHLPDARTRTTNFLVTAASDPEGIPTAQND